MKRSMIGVAAAALALALASPAGAYDRDCSDFSSWRAAQRFYKSHNPQRDPHRLDADRDGIACESLR